MVRDNVMTEQEAIEALKLEGGIEITGKPKRISDFFEALEVAIEALKEVQQYKDNRLCLIPEGVYSKQCEELDAYKEIGTVEECREAAEKQKPKAPKDSLKIKPVIDENGAYVDADVTVYILCPNCGELVGMDEDIDRFCRECGQAILREGEDD